MFEKRITLNRLLVAWLTAGFAFLLMETYLEHSGVLDRERVAITPILFSLVAAPVCAALTVAWKPSVLAVARVVLLLAILVGLAGAFFHNEERLERVASLPAAIAGEEGEGERAAAAGERSEDEGGPPPLAPLSFVGMGVLGLLAVARRWPADVASRDRAV